jgi:WD40 repeat protein
LLKALAEGEPDALPSKEAKAALDRLANPSAARMDEPEAAPEKPAALTAVSPDGKFKAGPGMDGSIRVWETATGKVLFNFRGDKGVSSVAFTPDGAGLIIKDAAGAMTWNLNAVDPFKDK